MNETQNLRAGREPRQTLLTAIEHDDAEGARPHASSLQEALQRVRLAEAERSDVVIEMKEAERARLELILKNLEPVIAEIPQDEDRFDFALSQGNPPRLWIDATAHIHMGRDKRNYRFVADTRLGRVVLIEATQVDAVVARVTDYVAERIYERELLWNGERMLAKLRPAEARQDARAVAQKQKPANPEGSRALSFVITLLLGAALGAGALIAYAWFQPLP